uniref:SHSP domain-containing protein n=1 Tax=Globodera rostochiensis TaxID=31243 RepID=A0A914H0H5_GLORO
MEVLHAFGKQVQQLLGAEAFGFDNVNNIKCALRDEFGYCADEKATEFGYESFRELLNSKVMEQYVEIVQDNMKDGRLLTRYKAKHDKNTSAVYREQMIFHKDKERKDQKMIRQMERNFEATLYPYNSSDYQTREDQGQSSAINGSGDISGFRQYNALPQQSRQYFRRDRSPAMEMNGALDNNWCTNDDEAAQGEEEGKKAANAKAKVQSTQPPIPSGEVSEWGSDEQQQPPRPVEEEDEMRELPSNGGRPKTRDAEAVGISSCSTGSWLTEEQNQLQQSNGRQNTGADFVGIGSWLKEKKKQQQQSGERQKTEAELVGTSCWPREEQKQLLQQQQQQPPLLRPVPKKPNAAVKLIQWSDDEDDGHNDMGSRAQGSSFRNWQNGEHQQQPSPPLVRPVLKKPFAESNIQSSNDAGVSDVGRVHGSSFRNNWANEEPQQLQQSKQQQRLTPLVRPVPIIQWSEDEDDVGTDVLHLAKLRISDQGELSYKVNVNGFHPEEIKVELKGNEIVVQGEHREQNEGESVYYQFARRAVIPEGVQKESIKCQLDSGRLCITGTKITGEGAGRAIPIEVKSAMEHKK